jgi:hypothetical protein
VKLNTAKREGAVKRDGAVKREGAVKRDGAANKARVNVVRTRNRQ